MELHHPAPLGVLPGAVEQQGRLITLDLLLGEGLSPPGLFQGCSGHAVGHWAANQGVQAVVSAAAAVGVKVGDPFRQCLFHLIDGAQGAACRPLQPLDVGGKPRLLNVYRRVRPETGQHLHGEALVRRQLLVVGKVGAGVVGGADHLHVALKDQPPGSQGGVGAQLVVALFPHLPGCSAGKEPLIAKVVFQLQVAPLHHRVSNGPGQGFGKLFELLPTGALPGDKILLHTVPPHQPPLVVVSSQPHLGQVVEPPVLPNLFGVNVAVVVRNGHPLGILVVEFLAGLRVQQEGLFG